MGLLVKGHNDLVEAYNKNMQMFIGPSMAAFDERIGAMQLVLNDMVVGEQVTTHEVDGKKAVHWEAYGLYYRKKLSDAALNNDIATDKLITPETPEVSDDVVFGGEQGAKDGQAIEQTVGA